MPTENTHSIIREQVMSEDKQLISRAELLEIASALMTEHDDFVEGMSV
ncbi:MAG: DUF2498 family protein, partial [Plesiomonas sp.]